MTIDTSWNDIVAEDWNNNLTLAQSKKDNDNDIYVRIKGQEDYLELGPGDYKEFDSIESSKGIEAQAASGTQTLLVQTI